MKRRITILTVVGLGAVLFDWAAANWILWSSYDNVAALLREPERLRGQQVRLEVHELSPKARTLGAAELFSRAGSPAFRLAVNYDNHPFELASGAETHITAAKSKAHFAGAACNLAESRRALADVADALPKLSLWKRLLAGLWYELCVFAWDAQGEPCWDVHFHGGHVAVAWSDGLPREVRYKRWLVTFRREPLADDALASAPKDAPKPTRVEAVEMDKSLAAVLRILTLQLVEVPREADALRREGNGSLEIKDGRRVLRLRGKPYDIGLQHGRLLVPNIKRLCERVIYGVGFFYSIEKGEWFLDAAAKLVERQRPFIAPEYFEEMRGVADGAGLPLATVQAANIFPEFFHCSGVAVFGKATRGGALLHARVLDYMTEVGLQDEAVTMAIEREGARRFVNVGYAGFIGSVTGMNEKQVAIGEMGGRGEGKWDGTPMAQLLRGALENCDTLEEALDYMRRRPRTCEYYYVVSDGKSRTARGVAATPETFQIIKSAEIVPLLPEPVEDAVLLSEGKRYKLLVKRVREMHGRIGPEEMQRIIARGVAMKSNLHDAIFEPAALTLWIANASRHRPACDERFVKTTWAELFPR
ncbi:MAG: C45 family autoproteolytic acyltransferase/hydrolase [Verrucomicrobia bacterium]|nr:C45 family autoproteolytic acyltransferase/hydrolase [Verrucomicrobiota bacterium]